MDPYECPLRITPMGCSCTWLTVQQGGATTQNILIPLSLGWDTAVAITLLLAVFPVFLLSHPKKKTAKSHAELSQLLWQQREMLTQLHLSYPSFGDSVRTSGQPLLSFPSPAPYMGNGLLGKARPALHARLARLDRQTDPSTSSNPARARSYLDCGLICNSSTRHSKRWKCHRAGTRRPIPSTECS